MSGGVDSAVVAAMLNQQGYEVLGYTLKLLEEENGDNSGCCSFKDIRDATMVCGDIGIDHIVQNWKQVFKKDVIDRYVSGAKAGITYNPCVTCNSSVKLPVLVAVANHFGCEYVATGHYARVRDGKILRAVNLEKDQSYFLWNTPSHLLNRFLFPLGDIPSKTDTRSLARSFNLHVADKKDSTDLCFLANTTKEQFLEKHGVPSVEGTFIDASNGAILGKHKGYTRYVLGQRANIGGAGQPRYVLDIIPNTNKIIVGNQNQGRSSSLMLADARMTLPGDLSDLTAVIRYHSPSASVKAISCFSNDHIPSGIFLELDRPVHAARGQSCVIYNGDEVVGGGIIT